MLSFAHMRFTVPPGATEIAATGNLCLRPGQDGIVTTDAQFVIPPLGPATINMVPEPGTIALLACVPSRAAAARSGTEVPHGHPSVIDLRGATRSIEDLDVGLTWTRAPPWAGGLLPCRSSRSSTC